MPNYLPSAGFFSWKGQTFNQITTTIQKNKATISAQNGTNAANLRNYFIARPLKVYRREIATNDASRCNYRTSVRIDELNTPGGYIITNSYNDTGLVNTLDINLTTNTYLRGAASCNTSANCFSQSANALRRVRSSGMIRRKYDPITNDARYFTNTNQYLDNRHKTYQKNQFTFVDPDTGCAPIYKPSNEQFSTQGAVSSSSHVARVKYDTVNTIASRTRAAYGNDTANALAYSSKTVTYTIKDKVGFPRKCTPKVQPNGTVRACMDTHI